MGCNFWYLRNGYFVYFSFVFNQKKYIYLNFVKIVQVRLSLKQVKFVEIFEHVYLTWLKMYYYVVKISL